MILNGYIKNIIIKLKRQVNTCLFSLIIKKYNQYYAGILKLYPYNIKNRHN